MVEVYRKVKSHPVAAVNVAPEFGVAETEAYLFLHELETFAFNSGFLGIKSNFYRSISYETVKCEKWRKWMIGDSVSMSIDDVLADEKLVKIVTQTSGHYVFEAEAVKDELTFMFQNLEALGLQPYKIVIDRIKQSIARYVECLNLEGLTSKIKNL